MNKFWTLLKQQDQRHATVLSETKGKEEKKGENGLVYNHCYSLLGVVEFR